MRQPQSVQLGAQGQRAVEHAFVTLGWGVTSAPEFDLGTDVFLLVRDDLFDLGLVTGAQIKTGASFFDEPQTDDVGETTGWWFRADRQHVDTWLTHALPHLIVLHDPDTGLSYWQHITDETVQHTGKGAKILVPRANTIDADHLDALLALASTKRQRPEWEGSVWASTDTIPAAGLWRHALIVPRLVAPHPNAGFSQPVGPEQVLALLIEMRLREIDHFATKFSEVPKLEDAAASPDWRWRFVGAFAARMITGAIDQLPPLVEDAPSAEARTAATVAAAAALLEHARVDEALELLETVLAGEDVAPVDRAWLRLQHARACAEVGRVDDARASANEVQRVRLTGAERDATVTAIAGVATLLLFNLSAWATEDIREVVTGLDTTAIWWRFQRQASGATAVVEREFTAWTRYKAITIGATDRATHRLLTASVLASHVGDHSAWRHLEALNVEQALLRTDRTTDPDTVFALLSRLRLSGEDKPLDRAVQRLVKDGPAEAVRRAAQEIDFTYWTRTTSRTTLSLLLRGWDIVDESTSTEAVRWLLNTLRDPTAFIERTGPTFDVDVRLVDTLTGLACSASSHDADTIIEHILALPPQNEVTAASWSRVVTAIPRRAWTAELANRAAEIAEEHPRSLTYALLGVAAPVNEAVRDRLLREAKGNSLYALSALGDTTELPDDVAQPLLRTVNERLTSLITQARQTQWPQGAFDEPLTAALLNATHPAVAEWDPLYDLLAEPLVAAKQKRGACQALAELADDLSPEVKDRLKPLAQQLVSREPSPIDDMDTVAGMAGDAARLAAVLTCDRDEIHRLLLGLLQDEGTHRASAARLARHLPASAAAGVLTPLTQGSDPSVRAAAAGNLARLLLDGDADDDGAGLAFAVLKRCLEDPGTAVGVAIAATLADRNDLGPELREIRDALASHRSAWVRAAVATS